MLTIMFPVLLVAFLFTGITNAENDEGPLDLFNYKGSLGELPSLSYGMGNFKAVVGYSSTYRSYRPGKTYDGHQCDRITAVPRHLTFITRYGYYSRYLQAYNIPVISSSRVGDAALKRACYVLRFLLADRLRLRKYLYWNYGRVGIIGRYENTNGIPEHRFLDNSWNTRARGLGGTLRVPISTGTEENLLCERTDRYPREDIFLHEFSHGIQEVAVRGGGIPTFFNRLTRAYNSARYRGLWRSTYAMSTVQEYFAEGTQSYFNVNDYRAVTNGIHGPISTRAKLRGYDPTLYRLVKEVFPCLNNIWKRCTGGRMTPFKMNCDGDGKQVTVGGTGGGGGGGGGTNTKQTPKPNPTGSCADKNQSCSSWAGAGYCSKYAKYMLANCKKSCKSCGGGGASNCKDINPGCPNWKSYCSNARYAKYMKKNCKKSCNFC